MKIISNHEEREVAIVDIPNTFIQTDNPKKVVYQRGIIKIRGKLSHILVDIVPEVYRTYITYENVKGVLYLELLKLPYRMLILSVLFYQKSMKDLEPISFKVYPYDPCVFNKITPYLKPTVTWHVDDLKVSHADKNIVDAFIKWTKKTYKDIKNSSHQEAKYVII